MPDEEPSDEECEAIAMFLGDPYRFVKTVRVYGKKVIRNDVDRTYHDPVTLEVTWTTGKNSYGVMTLIEGGIDVRPTRT